MLDRGLDRFWRWWSIRTLERDLTSRALTMRAHVLPARALRQTASACASWLTQVCRSPRLTCSAARPCLWNGHLLLPHDGHLLLCRQVHSARELASMLEGARQMHARLMTQQKVACVALWLVEMQYWQRLALKCQIAQQKQQSLAAKVAISRKWWEVERRVRGG